jgi:hypothetical protein
MKAFRIGLLFAFVAIVGAMVVCQPTWLADNEFLKSVMTHELLGLLVVILTITFASVANIHLAITRMVSSAGQNRDAANESARGIRREINSNAWTIFAAFIVAVGSLLWKGAFPHNVFIVAASHAIGLIVIMVNVLILHDIYRAIFGLAGADTGGTDHTDDAPRAR